MADIDIEKLLTDYDKIVRYAEEYHCSFEEALIYLRLDQAEY